MQRSLLFDSLKFADDEAFCHWVCCRLGGCLTGVMQTFDELLVDESHVGSAVLHDADFVVSPQQFVALLPNQVA